VNNCFRVGIVYIPRPTTPRPTAELAQVIEMASLLDAGTNPAWWSKSAPRLGGYRLRLTTSRTCVSASISPYRVFAIRTGNAPLNMSDQCQNKTPSIEADGTDSYRISVPADSPLGGCVAGCVAGSQLRGSCSTYDTGASAVRQVTLDGVPAECAAISELVAGKLRGGPYSDADGTSEKKPGSGSHAGLQPVLSATRPVLIWIATSARASLAPLLAHLDPDPDIHVGGVYLADLAGLADHARQHQPDVLLFDCGASGLGVCGMYTPARS
jgi:hypothetical protein